MSFPHVDPQIQEAIETLGVAPVCGGCGSSSQLSIGNLNPVLGLYVQCTACKWDGYVTQLSRGGW